MSVFSKRTWVEINLDNIEENIKNARLASGGKEIMAVVKANAYGHGDITVCEKLIKLGIKKFAVSNICEAVHLRRNKIEGDILILGYTPEEDFCRLWENDIVQAVTCAEYARSLSAHAASCGKKIRCHIKFDTGMGRIGFDSRNSRLLAELEELAGLPGLEIEGAFTHFAVADSRKPEDILYTENQQRLFESSCELLEGLAGRKLLCHSANSAGGIFYAKSTSGIHRLGISLYGLTPDPSLEIPYKLMPAMEFKSVVSMVKTIRAGESVSYGRTFTAAKDTVVATVPVGYADGYRRGLSGRGEVLLHGKRAKIIGRVCMDQLMLDVTDIEGVHIGDTVTLFGRDGEECIPVEEIAEACGTINYEIVCDVAMRVPRVYIEKGKVIKAENYI